MPISILPLIRECEIIPGILSDHSFVSLTVIVNKTQRGEGFWKFNNSLLKDKKYLDQMNNEIDKSIQECKEMDFDPSQIWETLKMVIQNFSKDYGKLAAYERKKNLKFWNKKLATQEKRLACINLQSDTAIETIQRINIKIDEIRNELNKIYAHRAEGAMLRASVRWTEQSEKNTKYFFGLEKMKSKNKMMSAIQKSDRSITRDMKQIIEWQVEFYEKLYTKDSEVKFEYENSKVKIDDILKGELEEDIKMEEVSIALKEMKSNKAPGLDGLTADFYKIFYARLKIPMFEAIKYAITVNRLHDSARRGVLTLLPKASRNVLQIGSWRPISLLCVDFKIYSKVLANRMKKGLNQIISEDQTGFLKGKSIQQNIRRAMDIMEYTKANNVSALLISIDFLKAFDRVDYEAMYKAMQYFGFGEKFINHIKILFRDFALCTSNGGHLSKWWKPSRGLFQGNPIAPYLFLVVIELLSIKLKEHPHIEGITIANVRHLVSQFADDMDLFVKCKKEVWYAVMETLRVFEKASGMKINYDKTTVYRIGSIRNTNAKFYSREKIKWTNEPVNILGVWLDHQENVIRELNLDPLVQKTESLLKVWKARDLSLLGRILILNTLVASLFVYRMSVIRNIPDTWFSKMRRLFTDFVWKGGKHKIKWEIVTGNKEDGGLGLVDLTTKEKACKIAWVVKAYKSKMLTSLVEGIMQIKYSKNIWLAKLSQKDCENYCNLDNFWGDVFVLWQKLCKIDWKQQGNVLSEPICLNSDIRIEKNIIYKEMLMEKGIAHISDLIENNQIITWLQFKQKFPGILTCLEYNGIVTAIHRKQNKLDTTQAREPNLFERLLKSERVSNFVYRTIQKKDELLKLKASWWSLILEENIQTEELKN